ncbi:hypothetical protein AX17_001351 [Amanita inopinata Kibby_2008]|nr:hypothetical protein AX17_001351 [Amanita inopinata Kibby_2008]
MSSTMTLPDAIDLSHHLSRVSKKRRISPLKGLQQYFGKPGIISLAGGLPHPDYFPFSAISGDLLLPDSYPATSSERSRAFSWIWNLFASKKERTVTVTVPKYPQTPGDISLSTALQYSLASGLPLLQKIVHEFTAKVFQPGYGNFTTFVHTGNTDGWAVVVETLCDPGQGVLTSEWTYPSAIAAMEPHGIKPIPVAMDSQGMRSDALRTLLSEWDETSRGMPRPHVLYIIPTGQNPTGATMELNRKKEIYDVCVDFDIIIVEDDPYYFLQEGPYVPATERIRRDSCESSDDSEDFLSQLAPSYLRLDYQGRVIRLDTFSKTIAPGCRLGWYTCNPVFAERIERQSETTTQAPCGFGQSMVTSLLLEWKFDGYIRWLRGLRMQYRQRRDFFVDCLWEQFDLGLGMSSEGAWTGCTVLTARQKHTKPKGPVGEKTLFNPVSNPVYFSFVPPTSGMFVWLRMHFEHHPLFPSSGSGELETNLWTALAEAGVLFGPGKFHTREFYEKLDKARTNQGNMFVAQPEPETSSGFGHFRVSFSNAEFTELKSAVKIFASVLEDFWKC